MGYYRGLDKKRLLGLSLMSNGASFDCKKNEGISMFDRPLIEGMSKI